MFADMVNRLEHIEYKLGKMSKCITDAFLKINALEAAVYGENRPQQHAKNHTPVDQNQ